jgi:hypothetical protein
MYTWSKNKPTKPGYYWHKYDLRHEPGDWWEIVEIYVRLDNQLRVKFLERFGFHDKLLDDEMFDNNDYWSECIEEPVSQTPNSYTI